uniref:Uncharacterized protein n=1 Tax=Arundo donax TaxID=35708 RepID=A0A0A8ZW58_ARUDO
MIACTLSPLPPLLMSLIQHLSVKASATVRQLMQRFPTKEISDGANSAIDFPWSQRSC